MIRPSPSKTPVSVWVGAYSLPIPVTALVATGLLLGLSWLFALDRVVLPLLFGTTPVVSLPAPFRAILLGLAYLGAIAVMICAMLRLLGLAEQHRANRRVTDLGQLMSLSDAMRQTLAIAPNLSPQSQTDLMLRLQTLAGGAGISSILAPVRPADVTDGALDRLFVTTTLPPRQFRQAIRPLCCDDAARVPDRLAGRLRTKAAFGPGTIWLLTWD